MEDFEEAEEASLGSDFWDGVADHEFSDFSEPDSDASPSRVPGPKRKSSLVKPLLSCHKCYRPYKSIDSYKKHLKMHIAEDLYRLAPGYNAVHAHCRMVGKTLLRNYSSAPLMRSVFSSRVVSVANCLLAAEDEVLFVFLDFVTDLLWKCVPSPEGLEVSAFHKLFMKSVNHNVLTSSEVRDSGVELLRDCLSVSEEDKILKIFIGDFITKISSEVELFYFKCIREPHQSLLFGGKECLEPARDDPEDASFQSSIYYIGGSTVRSVFRKGRKSSSPMWKKILDCISDRMLVGEQGTAPEKDVTNWTDSRDRGGLFHITEPMWTFLMALSGVLKKVEDPDGSVFYSKVLDSIHADDIICLLWSDVVSDKLNEDESNFLLKEVCVSFAGTWGKGVALRRKNAIAGLSKDKVALRPSLVPH